jgi:hypothetical protein
MLYNYLDADTCVHERVSQHDAWATVNSEAIKCRERAVASGFQDCTRQKQLWTGRVMWALHYVYYIDPPTSTGSNVFPARSTLDVSYGQIRIYRGVLSPVYVPIHPTRSMPPLKVLNAQSQ